MPPKFALKPLAIQTQEDDGPAQAKLEKGYMQETANGIAVLTNSYNPVVFTSEGMSKNGTFHYKLSEKDIYIMKRLGAGASSTVFKGFLKNENRFVACKKINIYERDTRLQMLNDLKALCDAPNCPGLIQFYGAYHIPDSGQISIVLEYMDGGSLADVLQKVGKIPENVLSKITHKVLRGLSTLHRMHMVHRDIKPANILINLDGDSKITDFGISAFIDSTLAVCKTFLGTATYMSPERINNQDYSFPADLWSLGVALIECATGKYPYDVSPGPLQLMIQVLNEPVPIPTIAEGYSSELVDFITKCMHKEPLKRSSVDQLLQHPFILKHTNDPVNLKRFMSCVFDPHDKLDEIALVFAWNYYLLLSGGEARLKDLTPLYAENSLMSLDGEVARGGPAIIRKLKSVVEAHAGFKIVYEPEKVDCQPHGVGGSALVHVQGHLVPQGRGMSGTPFAETFILAQFRPAEYYVANQCFRILKESPSYANYRR